MIIKNGNVHDGLGGVKITDVRIEDGKIAALGENLTAAEGEEVFDAAGMEVLPGFIHTISCWGVNGTAMEIRPSAQDNAESSNPITPELDAFYAFNGRSASMQQLGAFGLTACGVAPADTNLFGGQIAAFAVDGVNPYKMCLKRGAGMMASVCGSMKEIYGGRQQAPQTRMWIFTQFAEQLRAASAYNPKPEEKEDTKLLALKEVIEGRMPLFVSCDTVTAVEHVRDITAAYPDMKLVLVNGFGLTGEEDWLIERNIPVIVRTPSNVMDENAVKLDLKAIAALQKKGATIAMSGCYTNMFAAREDMLWNCAEMLRVLPDPECVLSMVTSTPAKLLGIDDETGSIQQGLRADLVIWSADPLKTYEAHVVRTYQGGRVIYRKGDEMKCM